jgi:hypothetical protein
VETVAHGRWADKIDPNSSHLEGQAIYTQFRAALKVAIAACRQELYDRRNAEQSEQDARSSRAEAREAKLNLKGRENLISMMTNGACLMRAIADKQSLKADNSLKQAIEEEIKVLRLKEKLVFVVDKTPVSEIEQAIAISMRSPPRPIGTVGPERIRKRMAVFEEIWSVNVDTKTALAVMAEVGWWIFGPRLAVVMDEAHYRALIFGEAMRALAAAAGAHRHSISCPLARDGASEALAKA